MKTRNYFLKRKLTLLLLNLTTFVYAQHTSQPYTLQYCIEQALQNNINIKQKDLSINTAKVDYLQSKLSALPSINAQFTNNYNTGFAINPLTNTTQRDVTFRSNNIGINGSMVLFNGFQTVNTIRLQKSNTKAVELDVATAKQNLALQVANAYLQVLLNDEIVQTRKLQWNATNEQVNKQKRQFEFGGLSKVKYLQIKAQASNEEAQLVAAQTMLDQAYLTLWQLINIEPDTALKIEKPDFNQIKIESETKTAKQIYEDFLTRSTEISAAKQRVESARLNYSIALGGRSPRLTLGGGFNSFYTTQSTRGTGNPSTSFQPIGIDSFGVPVYAPFTSYSQTEVVPFSDQFDKNLGKSIGFTLSIPIFNGWQINSNIKKQYINQLNASLTKKQVETDIYKNVNQAYLDFLSAQKKYQAGVSNYEANKETFDLASAQFELGALGTADFVQAKNQFLQAETTMLQNKFELLFRRKVLDYYLGKPLY